MIAAIYARKSTEQNGVADEVQVGDARRLTTRERSPSRRAGPSPMSMSSSTTASAARRHSRRCAPRLDCSRVIKSGPPFNVLLMQAPDRLSRRDGDEAFGELKAIARAGVGIWFYADGTRFEFGTFATNTLGFLRSEFAAEFRRAIATKTAEAMKRKAQRGHVTGGRCFGYVNVDVGVGVDAQGRASRSHVERRIEESEAEVVKEIFELAALGWRGGDREAPERQRPQASRGRSTAGRAAGVSHPCERRSTATPTAARSCGARPRSVTLSVRSTPPTAPSPSGCELTRRCSAS